VNIPIVYEDQWLLVVDKPSGLLTVPTPKKETRTLTSILGIYPCHRLDRETSGLIIYAKDRPTQEKMAEEFRQKKVKKTYTAFLRGIPDRDEGRIDFPIENQGAVTNYKIIAKRKDFAIVEVRPLTGRTNQIRIHFKQIGHPVLGERVFAFRKDFTIKAKRLCLHAQELEFTHPVTHQPVHLKIDLPPDLQLFLKEH